MRIGINTLFMITGKVGGTETYLRNLIINLAKIDTINEYILFTNKENSGTFGINQDNFSEVFCSIPAELKPLRVLWEQLILPLHVRKHKIDILHSPGYVSPIFLRCKSVVSLLDMQYHYYPENFSKMKLLYWKYFIPISARRADKVITISKNSKRDILKILHLAEENVIVTYLACDDKHLVNVLTGTGHDKKAEMVKHKYKLGKKFILTVATFLPHKNTDGLLRALRTCKDKFSTRHQLVLVGIKIRKYLEMSLSLINDLGLENDVKILGHVPSEDLPFLYSLADLYILPSFFEGFGLPVLEAMACGTPVISSNTSSLPEVGGDAAITVNPHSIEDMAEAINKVLTNMPFRQELIQKGLERVKQFSWEKMARETLKVYQEICDRLN